MLYFFFVFVYVEMVKPAAQPNHVIYMDFRHNYVPFLYGMVTIVSSLLLFVVVVMLMMVVVVMVLVVVVTVVTFDII